MASPKFNRERAARILVDAITFGDKTASDRNQVSEKTLQRYRSRLVLDDELSARVRELGVQAEHGWHFARARFLRRSLEKMESLLENAGIDHMDLLTKALTAAGELDLTSEALGVGVRSRKPGPAPSEDPSGSAGDDEAEDPDEGAGTPEGG